MVGSTGTQTQAFQLLKDNKITFKNGTIYSEKAKMLVQNYSDLTLEGMELTLNNANYAPSYTLSNNNGNVVIDGTTINVNPAGGFAFDVCRYQSYPSVNVTVKGGSVINGDIEVSASNSDAKDGFGLTLTSGTLNGNIVMDASAAAAMDATPEKVSIKKADAFEAAAPSGYKWESNGDGTSTLKPEFSGEYVLRNGVPYEYSEGVESVAKVTYRRTFSTAYDNNAYQCWYLPFNYTIKSEDLEKFDFYKIQMIAPSPNPYGGEVEDVSKIYIYIQKLAVGHLMKGNIPYVIQPIVDLPIENYEFVSEKVDLLPEVTGSRLHVETAYNEFDFEGVYRPYYTTIDNECYTLNNHGQITPVQNAETRLPNYRWVLKVISKNDDSANYTFVFTDEDPEVDGISDQFVLTGAEIESIYSVDGRKLDQVGKGLNIIKFTNGLTKKVYIK